MCRGGATFLRCLSVHPILMNAKAWKHLVGMSSNLALVSADFRRSDLKSVVRVINARRCLQMNRCDDDDDDDDGVRMLCCPLLSG